MGSTKRVYTDRGIWRWRYIAGLLTFFGTPIVFAAWAFQHGGLAFAVPLLLFCSLFLVPGAAMIAPLSLTVRLDDAGLEGRTILRSARLSWSDVDNVFVFRARQFGGMQRAVVQSRAGRTIEFSDVLEGFDDLVREIRERAPHAADEDRRDWWRRALWKI